MKVFFEEIAHTYNLSEENDGDNELIDDIHLFHNYYYISNKTVTEPFFHEKQEYKDRYSNYLKKNVYNKRSLDFDIFKIILGYNGYLPINNADAFVLKIITDLLRKCGISLSIMKYAIDINITSEDITVDKLKESGIDYLAPNTGTQALKSLLIPSTITTTLNYNHINQEAKNTILLFKSTNPETNDQYLFLR